MWPMEEYAISRLKLVCPIAASEPSSIEQTETSTINCCHDATRCPNGMPITRRISAIAATFGAVLRNAVTGVGAPSYTSGVHIWNGTAEILNTSPAITKTTPTISPVDA